MTKKNQQIIYNDSYEDFIWPGIGSFVESIQTKKQLKAAIIEAALLDGNFNNNIKSLGWKKIKGKYEKIKNE